MLVLILYGMLASYPTVAGDEPVNVALGKPTTTSSARGMYTGDRAVDGEWDSTASRWLTSEHEPGPHWLVIDLLEPHVVHSARIWTGHRPGGSDLYVVTEFRLQYWDGEGWIDIPGASVKGNREEVVSFSFAEPVITERIRFYTERADWAYNIVRVREIMIFGYPVDDEG